MDDDPWDLTPRRDARGWFPGCEVLVGQSPREVLHRLVDHDPFELGARSEARLDARALLLPQRRVWLRALARVAYASMRYAGDPPLDPWLGGRVDAAIDEIQSEEVEAEYAGDPPGLDDVRHLVFVSERFGIEIGSARRSCNRFNALPDAVRATFFALAVHGKPVRRWVAEGNGPPLAVREDLNLAFCTLSTPPDPDPRDFPDDPW